MIMNINLELFCVFYLKKGKEKKKKKEEEKTWK